MTQPNKTFVADTREANARLIAAAPAMLEALQALVAWHDVGKATQPIGKSLEQARAAIKQATGE